MYKRLCWVVAVLLLLLPGKQIEAASRCGGNIMYNSALYGDHYICFKCGAEYSTLTLPSDRKCTALVEEAPKTDPAAVQCVGDELALNGKIFRAVEMTPDGMRMVQVNEGFPNAGPWHGWNTYPWFDSCEEIYSYAEAINLEGPNSVIAGWYSGLSKKQKNWIATTQHTKEFSWDKSYERVRKHGVNDHEYYDYVDSVPYSLPEPITSKFLPVDEQMKVQWPEVWIDYDYSHNLQDRYYEANLYDYYYLNGIQGNYEQSALTQHGLTEMFKYNYSYGSKYPLLIEFYLEDPSYSVCSHNWVPGGTASVHEKCSMCGATQGGHSLVPTIIQNHSCTTSEVTRYSCSCGYYTDTTTKAATGHNSLNRVCNRDGTDTLSCSVCGGNQQVVGCVHGITVTLNADTNGGTPIDSLAPVVGQAFTLPEATKVGWEFVGWSPSATAISGRKGEVSYRTDTTLYAIFKKLLTLRCRDALGDNNQSETIYNNERLASIKLPQISGTDGWEVVGWTTVTEAKPSSTLAADTTIEVR